MHVQHEHVLLQDRFQLPGQAAKTVNIDAYPPKGREVTCTVTVTQQYATPLQSPPLTFHVEGNSENKLYNQSFTHYGLVIGNSVLDIKELYGTWSSLV